MSMQAIKDLQTRILAYADLSPEEQDASPEAEALYNEVTQGLNNKGADVVRTFSSDPSADEVFMSENVIATIMMTAAQYTGNPFLMMDNGASLTHIMHAVIGALVEAGFSLPSPDQDRITTPNAGE